MRHLTLKNIARACAGTLYNYYPEEDKEVAGVVLDSRQVQENYLFIATKGERADGHSFIPQVFAKGAAGVICEKEPEDEKGVYILVENSFQALKDIACFYRGQLDIAVVGITGSVGKTSTKEFIASVLEMRYKVLKTEGNHNNEIGLPLTILEIREEHEVAVLEMGISDFGEMHRLSEIARPDICVLTNIGQCHLENLKSREGILKAKSEIFDFMNEKGAVCVNGDDDMLRTLEEVKGKKPFTFGMNQGNIVYADGIENRGLSGCGLNIHINDKMFPAEIFLPGEHMVYDALAAVCVGSLMKLTDKEIVQGIASVKPVSGRDNILRLENRTVIDDCYNANPVSMRAALDLLATAQTRKVAVLGDMFELGKEEKKMHYETGAYAVKAGIDVVICIGELGQNMYQGACEARELSLKEESALRGEIYYFSCKKEFLEKQKDIVREKDTILVKASHGMAFEEIVKALVS